MKSTLALTLSLLFLLTLPACGHPAPVPESPEVPPPEELQSPTEPPAETPETPPSPQPGQFVFTHDNFPRLNGSTAMVPLGQAIASVLLGETREEVEDLIQFSRTTQSYRELMNGQADLLISGAPPEGIYAEKEEAGFEWKLDTFAVDGLVFMINADNPVDNLTTEQIRKIYTGEITNWREVGGDDVEIVLFQRNEEAGSQTAMKKLVMGGLPLMTPPAEYVSGAMGDLVEVIASYNDSASAIGYGGLYVPEAPSKRRGPLLALGANHRKKNSDFPGTPSSGLCGNSSRAAGSWRSCVGEKTGPIKSKALRQGRTSLFFRARGCHDEVPRSYHLKDLRSAQEKNN